MKQRAAPADERDDVRVVHAVQQVDLSLELGGTLHVRHKGGTAERCVCGVRYLG